MPYYSIYNKLVVDGKKTGRPYRAMRCEAKDVASARRKGRAGNLSWANAIKKRYGEKPEVPVVVKVVKLKRKPAGF